MTVETFTAALAKGQGRALLSLNRENAETFADAIETACLTDQRHDSQSEAERSVYLFELVAKAGIQERLISKLLTLKKPGEDWDHLTGLRMLREFARHGDRRGWEKLVQLASTGDLTAAERLPELGLEGLEWVIANATPFLTEETKHIVGTWIDDAVEVHGREFIESNGSNAVRQALRAEDARMAKLGKGRNTRPRTKEPTPREVLDQIQDGTLNFFNCREFARNASKSEMIEAAELLLSKRDRNGLHSLSDIWKDAKFPLDSERLVEKLGTHDFPGYLFGVLGTIDSPEVRQFALDRLRTRPVQLWAIEPLMSSYRPGDESNVLRALHESLESEDDVKHDLGLDTLNLLKKYSAIDPRPFLEWIVDEGPCSFCRNSAIRDLIETDTISNRILSEGAYDCDLDTRKIVHEIAGCVN